MVYSTLTITLFNYYKNRGNILLITIHYRFGCKLSNEDET